jgi:hypothetical protein
MKSYRDVPLPAIVLSVGHGRVHARVFHNELSLAYELPPDRFSDLDPAGLTPVGRRRILRAGLGPGSGLTHADDTKIDLQRV